MPGMQFPHPHASLGRNHRRSCGDEVGTKGVETEYDRLVEKEAQNSGFFWSNSDELTSYASPKILEGIIRNRQGKVSIVPGHDVPMERSRSSLNARDRAIEGTIKTLLEEERVRIDEGGCCGFPANRRK